MLYRKYHFCTYPLVFHPKFGDVTLELDDEQSSAVSQVPGLISHDVILENINLFNH